MRILIASLLLLAACTKRNENYCPGLQDNHCMYLDAAPDAAKTCTANSADCNCLIPAGMTQGTCVECIDSSHCTASEPVCSSDHRCQGCTTNNECGLGACLEEGACSLPSQVILAAPNGAPTAGCGTMPGQECSIAQALIEVGPPRVIIRLAPGMYGVTTADGLDVAKNATLAARGSTITRTGGIGPLVTVRPGQTLKLVGGTLRGLSASDGIRCDSGVARIHESVIESLSESGIEGNSCELTVSRSTLRDNLRGGINMVGDPKPVQITNNFVYRNGQSASTIGGMVLKVAGSTRVEFNTVVDNVVTATGGAGGIQCDGTYEPPYNLIFRNRGGIGDMVQVIGNCVFVGKSYYQGAQATDNSVGFEDPNNLTNPSYRLTIQAPIGTIREGFDCRDQVDHGGDPRPQGVKCDYGADEFRAGQ